MKKIYKVANCMHCPHSSRIDNEDYCTESNQVKMFGDYRIIAREDRFVLDDKGSALENKFPEWCLLEDYNQ